MTSQVRIALAATLASASLMPAGVAFARSDLAGRVLAAHGSPVPGATVVLYTAGPRVGTSVFCPSCYPDCGKSRSTRRDGRFVIPAVSDSLIFRVLVVAPGFEPKFTSNVDPRAGLLEVRLEARDPKRVEPARAIVGRVLDSEGSPVVGATIEPAGFHTGESGSFGYYPGTDALAVTDETGSFTLMTGDSAGVWDLRVRARNLAPAVVHEVAAGGALMTIGLIDGATVTGRVLRDQTPVSDVVVELGQAVRRSGCISYGSEQIATDANGRFTFVNVTPGQDYWLSGTLESFRPHGAASSVRVTVAEDDTVVSVPSLAVGPAHHLAGRVRLTDGKPVPPGTHLTIARDPLGGAAQILIDPEGRFATGGIPHETVQLLLRVAGYRLSQQTRGYLDRRSCSVVVDRDRDDIELILEPQ